MVQIVTSPEILDEYIRVLEELGTQHPEISMFKKARSGWEH
jgi:hypothetical protein